MSRLKPRSFLVLVTLLFAVFAYAVPTLADDDDPDKGHPDRPIVHRGDRYIPKAAGTKENLRFWFGPFLIPPGSDANRVNADLPLANGFITNITPKLRNVADLTEPSHQAAHIHHAHWFALDPGNKEDNYTYGNTEWIFGNGDEETKAEFDKRSDADPNGPIYGQYVGAQGPQLMIYMIHNKTSAPLNVYVVLDVTFIHGTKEELAGGKRPYHDLTGVLFGRTFDVPRKADGDGTFDTTHDMPKQGPIEWTSTIEGTIVGTGSHVHPGGTEVLVENLGSKESPCPNDGRGTGGTLLLDSHAVWRNNVTYSEDFQMEVTNPAFRAPIHKGDKLRITGIYENKDHAWYTAMTHEGIYIDQAQKPVGHCTPTLIGQAKLRKPYWKKVHKRVTLWRTKHFKVNGRPRVRLVKITKVVTRRVRVVPKPADPAKGVPNKIWGVRKDPVCGIEIGAFPCDRKEQARPEGSLQSVVHIANFLYAPGDQTLSGGFPKVKAGTSLTFINDDEAQGVRHSVTTCNWPCNGAYVANYPFANGIWDSGTLGYDAIDGGNPNPVAQTPTTLKPGRYAYFCRIHPWMRGAFEVIP